MSLFNLSNSAIVLLLAVLVEPAACKLRKVLSAYNLVNKYNFNHIYTQAFTPKGYDSKNHIIIINSTADTANEFQNFTK